MCYDYVVVSKCNYGRIKDGTCQLRCLGPSLWIEWGRLCVGTVDAATGSKTSSKHVNSLIESEHMALEITRILSESVDGKNVYDEYLNTFL